MAFRNKGNKQDLEQVVNITGLTEDVAKNLLEACLWNVESAVNMHLEGMTDSVILQHNQSAEEEVRPPIPAQRETLVEDPYSVLYPVAPRRRRARNTVFNPFRDFQVETRRQEELFSRPPNSSDKTHVRTLEDLFRPPIDIMCQGTFLKARDFATLYKKWLLVDVQNIQEFACQVLNRDIWANEAIRTIIEEHFVLWQVLSSSPEGAKYMTFYNVKKWPYVAVIDPRTGEKMKVWNKVDSSTFCDLLLSFLAEHQFIDSPEQKRPKLATSPKHHRRSGVSWTITSQDSLDSSSQDSYMSVKESGSDVQEAPIEGRDFGELNCCNEARESAWVPSDVSQNEENASSNHRRGNKKGGRRRKAPITSTITSETAEESCDTPLHPNPAANSNVQTTNSLGSCESSSSESCDVTYLGCFSQNKVDQQMTPEVSAGDDSSCTERFEFLLRLPNGEKDKIHLSKTAHIKDIVALVSSKGYPPEEYELVTNFPKRNLSTTAQDITLLDAGLHVQETIFVQNR